MSEQHERGDIIPMISPDGLTRWWFIFYLDDGNAMMPLAKAVRTVSSVDTWAWITLTDSGVVQSDEDLFVAVNESLIEACGKIIDDYTPSLN